MVVIGSRLTSGRLWQEMNRVPVDTLVLAAFDRCGHGLLV